MSDSCPKCGATMHRGRVVLSRDERWGRVPYWCRACGHHEVRTEAMRDMATNSDYQMFKPSFDGTRRPKRPTGGDILGPFYKPGAPFEDHLWHPCEEHPNPDPKDVLKITGVVTDTGGEPLAAVLDIWQADPKGGYDNEGFAFRGKVHSGGSAPGAYAFYTLRPGNYEIQKPGDPVEVRCAHIHVIVSAMGYRTLITQLYFADDRFNQGDEWFVASRGAERLVKFIGNNGAFDFVLERS